MRIRNGMHVWKLAQLHALLDPSAAACTSGIPTSPSYVPGTKKQVFISEIYDTNRIKVGCTCGLIP